MAVRVADTIKPMGSANFPIAEAADLSIVANDGTTRRIQDMYDNKELGGLADPTAANKMLVSKEDSGVLVWQEVDADNDELGNSAGYQTSSDVSSAISTALSTTLGVNYASGEFEANSITLASSSPSSTVSILPSGITINGSPVATQADIQGVTWTVSVVSSLPAQGQERVLYLVEDSSGSGTDAYEEYIWVITDSSTTPPTYGYEKIGDTNISLAATNITYSSNLQVGVTNVGASLDALNSAVPLQITSYSMTPNTEIYEKGTTLAAGNITIAWNTNKPLTSQTMNGTSLDADVRSWTNTSPISGTFQLFMLICNNGSQTIANAGMIKFWDSVYWGSSAIGTYNSAFVRALSNSELKEYCQGKYSMSVATNEYGFIAFPSSMSAPAQCKINGMITDMELTATINVTNASGATSEYKLYRTTNPSLGNLTLVYD